MRKNMNFTPEELTPPNTCYADMHHVALDVKKGINEQIKLVAGEDGKTFSIIRGREGVRVGLQKARAIGPYPIEEFQNEYGKLIRRGFRLTFDRAPSELVVKGNGKYKKMPDVDTEDIVSSLVEVSRQAFEDYYTVDTKRITDIPQISIDTARNMLLVMEKNLKTMSVKEFNDSLCIPVCLRCIIEEYVGQRDHLVGNLGITVCCRIGIAFFCIFLVYPFPICLRCMTLSVV